MTMKLSVSMGSCCACGKTGDDVINIVCIEKKLPLGLGSGKGWGCFACGLENDGAVAVVCESCLVKDTPIINVCVGYPGDDVRIEVESLTEKYEHDLKFHPEVLALDGKAMTGAG